jgi:hypothetical protein
MPLLIEFDGERFEVRERSAPNQGHRYEFKWANGPAGGTYGFAIGGGPLERAMLENAARGFVRSFYEPGGVGESDFPSFVQHRRAKP